MTGKRVVVMGLGRFGGGVGLARWLCAQGARVVVTDLADRAVLADSLARLEGLPIEYHLGDHPLDLLEDCDLLVINPAVDKARSEFVRQAVRRGIAWTSEMNLFFQRCPARIVGVTGTAGKSTTAAMTARALEAGLDPGEQDGSQPRVWLGGNIGRSLLEDLPAIRPHDLVVLELSSFQLEDLARLAKSPHVAVLTNLAPNHLDRHGTFERYAEAKLNIVRYQDRRRDVCVVNGEDDLALEWVRRVRGDLAGVWRFWLDQAGRPCAARESKQAASDTPLVSGPFALRVPGRHNRLNAAAALAVARILGSPERAAEALKAFAGLPHRLEFVREFEGVRYYNDSKSTTPEAAITALDAFEAPVVMIVGGYDKQVPLDALGRHLAWRAKAVVCMGATRAKLQSAVARYVGYVATPPVRLADSLPEAVEHARRLAAPGDVVVLSPGCASYDMFANYEHRGELFKRIVGELR